MICPLAFCIHNSFVIIEQVNQNHQLSLQKPGGEIRAQYFILKFDAD